MLTSKAFVKLRNGVQVLLQLKTYLIVVSILESRRNSLLENGVAVSSLLIVRQLCATTLLHVNAAVL